VIGLVVLWAYRQTWARPLLAGFGYYVVTLLPVLGFMDIYFMKYSLVADHWQYFSIVGIIALVVGLAVDAARRWERVMRLSAGAATTLLVGLLCVLTWRQTQIYHDEETLWVDTLAKNPSAWLGHYRLGVELARQGKLDEAVRRYTEVLRLTPAVPQVHNNLGIVLARQGQLDEAVRHYTEALRLKANIPETHNNLGNALARQGQLDEAVRHFTEALRLKAAFPEAHNNLADALVRQNRLEEAIVHYRQSLYLHPGFSEARAGLDHTLGQLAKVIQTTQPPERDGRPETLIEVGNAFADQGQYDRAIQYYTRALELEPELAAAHVALGYALDERGKTD
jgi:Flp pilus assembly protein TadD